MRSSAQMQSAGVAPTATARARGGGATPGEVRLGDWGLDEVVQVEVLRQVPLEEPAVRRVVPEPADVGAWAAALGAMQGSRKPPPGAGRGGEGAV